jgi:hypothetical protein
MLPLLFLAHRGHCLLPALPLAGWHATSRRAWFASSTQSSKYPIGSPQRFDDPLRG